MKLIKYSLIFLSIMVQLQVFGQKANTKNVYYTYLKPPMINLPDNVTSYYVKVINEAPSLSVNNDEKQLLIKIDSMERATSEAEADMLIKFNIKTSSSYHSLEKVTYKEKINDSTSVDREGGQYNIKVNIVISYIIHDKVNNQILQSESGKTYGDSFTSIRFDTYNKAVHDSNENKGSHITRMESELLNGILHKFNSKLNNDYGFVRTYMNVPIARGRGKHDYSDLEEAFELFDATVTAQNSTGLDDLKINNIRKCIETWENAIKQYEPGKRKARISDRNIGHIHFNVAIAKFMLKEWDGTLKMLEVVQSTKGQKYISDYLTSEVEEMRQRYANIEGSPHSVANVQKQ